MNARVAVALPLAAALGWAGVRVAKAYGQARTFPDFWRERAERAVPDGALRLVALGDSTMQAIGADTPLDGLAGRTAQYLEGVTGRPVHIANHATGGATVVDILREQVPQADLTDADVVIVSSGNDMEKRVAPRTYRAGLTTLVELLPPARTVLSDLPLEPGRRRYQEILAEVAEGHGILRADFGAVFTAARRADVFSWLFPHLNSRGYEIWFTAFQPRLDEVLRQTTSN